MADFDPDKYLQVGSFDPDKYLSKFDPDKYLGIKAVIPGTPEQPIPEPPVSYGFGKEASPVIKQIAGGLQEGYDQLQFLKQVVGGAAVFPVGLAAAAANKAKSIFTGEEQLSYDQQVANFTHSIVGPVTGKTTESKLKSIEGAVQSLNAVLPGVGHMLGNTPMRAKIKSIENPEKPTPTIRDLDAVIRESKALKEEPVKPIPAEAQMELPDAAMIRAPQYGVMEGMSRVDENGIPYMARDESGQMRAEIGKTEMPIKADLSMEAQNMQNPLQRSLWGDELLPKSPQEGIPLTQAIDNMFPAERSPAIWRSGLQDGALKATPELRAAIDEVVRQYAPKEGPFSLSEGMGRSQRGGMNMEILDPMFEKVKEIANGIKLIIKGAEEGPTVRAVKDGEEVARVQFSPKEWAEPTPKSNIVATHVRSNAKGKNLATEMYKFAAELKNDIEASPVQTSAGKHMWDKFRQQRLAEGNLIKAGDQPRNLEGMAKDLATFEELPKVEQDRLDAIAERLNHGTGGRQRGALYVPSPKTPKKDTVANPTSPENIQKKTELNQKARALKLTAYDRVTTIEEALAGVSKETDISKAGATSLRSGMEGTLRTNRNNTVINFLRTARQRAVNMFEEKSKQYVTGKDGIILSIKRTLKNQEAGNQVAEALIKGDREQMVFTEAQLDSIGWSAQQKETYFKIREALDARYAFMSEQAGLQGYTPIKPRVGYFPSNFNGAYTKFVGYTNKEGNWVTTGIAQGNTTFELKAALEKYKEMGPQYAESIDGGFSSIKDTKKSVKNYNGFAEIVSRLAEFDPEFAKAKDIADQHMMDQARTLYNFDVHEIKKSGVKGSLGDRPWLDVNKNTKDLFHSVVDYLETGFRYDAYQSFLMDGEKLVNDPKVKSEMPNTASLGQKYLDNIRGNNLNAFGAFVNSMVNTVSEAGSKVGVSTRFLPKTISAIQAGSTSLMMAFGNLGFAMMQMIQPVVGGIPEALRIKASVGLGVTDIGTSISLAPIYSSMMMFKLDKHVPPHIVEAWNWAKQHGLVDFSEAELAHNLESSPASNLINKSINAPIIYPEKATRMPVFIGFTDIFNKAGFKGEEALLRAQAATDYAMGNYHPDERPMIYSQMGEAGKMLGALSTYKHNLIEQNVSSVMNATKEPAAFAAMAAVAFGLYGVSGLPGYGDLDKVVKGITGKNIRELVLPKPREKNVAMDGLLSWYTETDFQSRLSMSSVLPDPQHPLSVAPHIQNFWNVTSSAIDFAVKQDQASLQQMISKGLPASFRNIYEVTKLSEEQVNPKTGEKQYVVKNPKGQTNTEQPRTENEMALRASLGLRPLRERLNSETTWTDSQREMQRVKDMKEARTQFEAAVRLNDMKGMARWSEKYSESGGDVRQLYKPYRDILIEGAKTPKQRAEGDIKANINSIRRYENYNY